MKVPPNGFTLEQICGLAGMYSVYIHIGVADADVAKVPPTITLQVSSKTSPNPVAFSMEMHKGPQMNRSLSVHLLDYIQRITPRRLKLVTAL